MVIIMVIFQGPVHGLQLTINVQHYEDMPFLEQDAGIKASCSFAKLIYMAYDI